MNKKIFCGVCFLLLIFFCGNVIAQTNPKTVIHTIVQGETLSSIAQKYSTTVGDIMRLNNMNATSVLKIGQKIKIPPAGKTVIRTGTTTTPPATVAKPPAAKPVTAKPLPVSASASKDSVAVTHVVAKGESLYLLAKKYNTSVANIKTWNKLTTDGVQVGKTLIVGHTVKTATVATPKQEPVKDTIEKVVVQRVDTQKAIITAPPVVEENKETETNNANPSSNVMVFDTVSLSKPQQKNDIDNTISATDATGFFTKSFGEDVSGRDLKTSNGMAMNFSTQSGWSDKKYYILMNDAPPGSIVKITNANKTIYAKVLWKLDNMKDNDGLQFRISDAAASALGIKDAKFMLNITFYE